MKGKSRPDKETTSGSTARKMLAIQWGDLTEFKIPIPPDEPKRLAALRRYDILDTPPERSFDDITQLAAHVCDTPMALIVLIDSNRQWFKAKVGVDLNETPREVAFCSYTIMKHDLMVVEDNTRDARFAKNPLVVSGPKVRFYAGAPLVTPDQRVLGTLCVLDTVRRKLSSAQQQDLLALSRLVMTELELRYNLRLSRTQSTARPRKRKSS